MSRTRRVVVTGLGVVSPLGIGVQHSWKQLIGSKSGIISTDELKDSEKYKDIPVKVIGKLPMFEGKIDETPTGYYNPLEHFTTHELRRYSPFIQYALIAAKEAINDANWNPLELSEE
jgi:3-oxoacyl-[acyl-carrier-protein] synthase II